MERAVRSAPSVDLCDLDPTGVCDAAGKVVENAANNAGEQFMRYLIESSLTGLDNILRLMSQTWFLVPSPTVGGQGGGTAQALQDMNGSLLWLTSALMLVSGMVAIMRMMASLQVSDGRLVLRMLFNVIATTSLVTTVTAMLIQFGDAFSPWIINTLGQTGNTADRTNAFSELLGMTPAGKDAAAAAAPSWMLDSGLLTLVLVVLTGIGAFMQGAFMVVRAPLIIILLGFMPLFAATTTTRQGQARFEKALAWLMAFVLYKPVAAIIYAMGLRLMKGDGTEDNPLMQWMWGMVVIIFAALALPALIKLFVPEAAVGSSNAFSGATGVAAGGAAVMGVAALGGAALTAGGSMAAGGAAAGAAGSGGMGAMQPPPAGMNMGGTGGPSGGGTGGPSGGLGMPGGNPSVDAGGSSQGTGAAQSVANSVGEMSDGSAMGGGSSGAGTAPPMGGQAMPAGQSSGAEPVAAVAVERPSPEPSGANSSGGGGADQESARPVSGNRPAQGAGPVRQPVARPAGTRAKQRAARATRMAGGATVGAGAFASRAATDMGQ